MQEKHEEGIDYLSALPVELVQEIAGNLNPKEAVHLPLASQQTLFKVQRNLTLNKKVYDIPFAHEFSGF